MNCEIAQDSLLLGITGELDARERSKLDQHLSQCERCRNAAQDLQRTQALVGKALATDVYAPDALTDRIMQEARGAAKRRAALTPASCASRWKPRLLPAFAAISLLLIGYILGFWHAHHTLTRRNAAGSIRSGLDMYTEEVVRFRRAKDRSAAPSPFRRLKPGKA